MHCPICAGEVQDQARKCKHCGEWIAEEGPPTRSRGGRAAREGGLNTFFKFGVVALLASGLAVLAMSLRQGEEVGAADKTKGTVIKEPKVDPMSVQGDPPPACGGQHGTLVFKNDLHERTVTVTVPTGHELERFSDHSNETVVLTLHHAETGIVKDILIGDAHIKVTAEGGETYSHHIEVKPRTQVHCRIVEGPKGLLTADVTVEDHSTKSSH
jgi:hypothetical protein